MENLPAYGGMTLQFSMATSSLRFLLDLSTVAIAFPIVRANHEHMTKLGAIRNNHLSIHCWFSNAGLIPVLAFIDKFGPDMSVHEAVTKTCCTKCGASVRARGQIIYSGNSEFPMTGSRTAKESDRDVN